MSERETPRVINQLSNLDVLRLASEAAGGGEELETARILLRHEMGRRGLVQTLETTSGVYDASEDEYKNPDHLDSQWQG